MGLIQKAKSWLRRVFRPRKGSLLAGELVFVCRNADGSIAWQQTIANGDTTAGNNDMLAVYFNAGTQKTAWYMGLIDNAGFSALAAADTISSHAGWTESVAYSDTTRRQWTPNAPSNGIITGATVTFNINGACVIKGGFIASDNTKSGTSGVLFASGAFSSPQTMANGQTLSMTYQKSLTPT